MGVYFNFYDDLRNENLSQNTDHWDYCNKNKYPYILIRSYNKKYDHIFYDITHLSHNLEEISDRVKKIYLAYIDFFAIPYIDVQNLFDEFYFFNLYIKKTHSEYISKQLFYYLLDV